jgi:hypothetical protein
VWITHGLRRSLVPADPLLANEAARMFNRREIIAVKIAQTVACLARGYAKNAFTESMDSAFVVNDHKNASITLSEDQAAIGERGLKTAPVIGLFETIPNRLPDMVDIHAEAAGLFKFIAGRGFHRALAFVSYAREVESFFQLAAGFLKPFFEKRKGPGSQRVAIDAAPR